jgi:hypothetical protein
MMIGGSNFTWAGGTGSSSSGSGSASGPSAPSGTSSTGSSSSSVRTAPTVKEAKPSSGVSNNNVNNNEKSKKQQEADSLPIVISSISDIDHPHHMVRRDFYRSPLDPADVSLPDTRPWYMRAGTLEPKRSEGDPRQKSRKERERTRLDIT